MVEGRSGINPGVAEADKGGKQANPKAEATNRSEIPTYSSGSTPRRKRMATAGEPIEKRNTAAGARRGRFRCLPDLVVDLPSELDQRETGGTPAATAAYQDARRRRGEVAVIGVVLGPGPAASTFHAAVQAVPGQLRLLPTGATASRARALPVGAVDLLPADISGPALLWTRQFPGEGAGRLTEPPPDTWMNLEPGGPDGIEGVPLEAMTPACRGYWGG